MLATDLHSPHVKQKLTKLMFIRNCARINGGLNFSDQFLSQISYLFLFSFLFSSFSFHFILLCLFFFLLYFYFDSLNIYDDMEAHPLYLRDCIYSHLIMQKKIYYFILLYWLCTDLDGYLSIVDETASLQNFGFVFTSWRDIW